MFEWLKRNSNFSVIEAGNDGHRSAITAFCESAKSNGNAVHDGSVHIENISITDERLVKLLDSFKLELLTSSRNKTIVYNKMYGWENGVLGLQIQWQRGSEDEDVVTGVNLEVYSTSEKEVELIIREAGKLSIKKQKNEGKIYVLTTTNSGLGLQTLGLAATEFLEGNYNESVVKDYNYIISELGKQDSNGRIVILDGPPGTGKTYLTRSLIKSIPNASFLIIPANAVDSLGDPAFINFFLRYRSTMLSPVVLVIEDADRCLVPRGADNMSAISTLLNMTDGITGHLLNLRVLATTNASLNDIDEAIRRPGRLLKHTHIGPLTADRARAVYKRLTGKEMELDSTTLADVYFRAKESTISEPEGLSPANKPVRKVGFF